MRFLQGQQSQNMNSKYRAIKSRGKLAYVPYTNVPLSREITPLVHSTHLDMSATGLWNACTYSHIEWSLGTLARSTT